VIELVLFDASGTLIDPDPSVGEIYRRAMLRHGLDAGASDIATAFRAAWRRHTEKAPNVLTTGRDEVRAFEGWSTVAAEVFDALGFDGDRDACFRDIFAAFSRSDAWRVYDDVRPALAALRARGVRVGLLSNWDVRLSAILEGHGLLRELDPVVISGVEGVAKPDLAIFRLAAERAGVAPERIGYVGDRVELDVEPARRAGMSAWCIDRIGGNGLRALTEVVRFLD
jgi:putative hydrolase of the HAD superfamily